MSVGPPAVARLRAGQCLFSARRTQVGPKRAQKALFEGKNWSKHEGSPHVAGVVSVHERAHETLLALVSEPSGPIC